MGDDDAKKLIMARRARFVAAALAGLAADGCGKTTAPADAGSGSDPSLTAPGPCLSVPFQGFDKPDAGSTDGAPPEDAAAPPTPQPCLSVAPQPCLSKPPPHPPPRPCLKVAAPRDDK